VAGSIFSAEAAIAFDPRSFPGDQSWPHQMRARITWSGQRKPQIAIGWGNRGDSGKFEECPSIFGNKTVIFKVGLSGASGRVGLEIAALLTPAFESEGDRFELSDAVAGSKKLTSIEGIPVRTLREPPWQPVHIWIDFSRPEATLGLLRTIAAPVVIGTTGFSQGDFKIIQKYAEQHPVLLAPNTSPGMNLMKSALKRIGISPSLGFDVIVEEEHHRYKKDSPSGTALELLEILRETVKTPIPVNVTRAGGIPGTHAVKWVSDEEELVIHHRVMNRKVFARGALLGAQFLVKIAKPGLYRMDDVLSGGH
jgi:4-hydroxy-tetrahydrodipicolinate reductase